MNVKDRTSVHGLCCHKEEVTIKNGASVGLWLHEHVQLESSMAGSLSSPGWARVLGAVRSPSYFAAPKGSGEQNVGDGPEQVVHTCRREGRAEHHDDS